jgi:hypothetical protein
MTKERFVALLALDRANPPTASGALESSIRMLFTTMDGSVHQNIQSLRHPGVD